LIFWFLFSDSNFPQIKLYLHEVNISPSFYSTSHPIPKNRTSPKSTQSKSKLKKSFSVLSVSIQRGYLLSSFPLPHWLWFSSCLDPKCSGNTSNTSCAIKLTSSDASSLEPLPGPTNGPAVDRLHRQNNTSCKFRKRSVLCS
jgi:hypothetical protein